LSQIGDIYVSPKLALPCLGTDRHPSVATGCSNWTPQPDKEGRHRAPRSKL